MPTDPLAQKSAIYDQFLRGEIDATTAAKQMRALPWTSPNFEYAPFAHGYSDRVLLEKLMEFNAASRALDEEPAA